jgi:hypothetical protein
MDMQPEKLVFVYNAKSGKLHGLLDLLHKNISPRTYPCQLCAVLPEWKQFIESLGMPVEFFHKDEWLHYPGAIQEPLPAAFAYYNGIAQVFIPDTEMRAVADVQALMKLTQSKLI